MISSPNYIILPSIAKILLFNSVFHDRVTPVNISIPKSLLEIIGVIPLKPQVSSIVETYI